MSILLTFMVCLLPSLRGIIAQHCEGHKSVYSSLKGVIKDSAGLYPNKISCEWLIKAPYQNQTITLNTTLLKIECEYDFLYIFDGGTYKAPLLGSFSGYDVPATIVSSSYEVFIVLQTDYAEKKDGFEISYEITDCPSKCSGHGVCRDGTCSCNAGRKGTFCQEEWCPSNCNQANSKGNCDGGKQKCVCAPGFSGEACSLAGNANADLNTWHKLSSSAPTFKPRSGHVAGYINVSDALWIFGGHSLNEVFDDTLMYNISSNSWHKIVTSDQPVGRFNHAGDTYKNYLVIFGGEASNGTLLNDLWMLDTIAKAWSQPTGHSKNKPTGVAGHSANVVDGKLYIFGGRTNAGGVSTDIYEFDLNNSYGWKKLSARGGKPSVYRLVGHSSVYNKLTNSLLIFGGELVNTVRRESAKQNRLLSFNLGHQIWTEISPQQQSTNPLPLPRAFHTAVVTGDYMIIYGGIVSTGHGKKCYLNDAQYYNLKCNMWVPASVIEAGSTPSSTNSPPKAGRFSHSSVLRDDQTMLVVGGFNGVMFGDVLAYRFPKAVLFKNNTGYVVNGQHCNSHGEKNECFKDPACGWCFDPLTCMALQDANSCNKAFDGSYCSSHCSAYTSCDSCISFGNTSAERCSWCIQDSKCYVSSSPGGLCSKSIAASYSGWWGSSSQLISNLGQCFTDNQPPGLTYTRYSEPFSFDFPESVSIVASSKIEEPSHRQTNEMGFLSGFVYPYILDSDPISVKSIEVSLSGVNVKSSLFLSKDQTVASKEEVAFFMYSNSIRTVIAKRKTSGSLFPAPTKTSRYYMQCAVNSTLNVSNRKMEIHWNVTAIRQLMDSKYLRPYHDGNCHIHKTCMACLVDAACGWCPIKSNCIAKSSWSDCIRNSTEVVYLATNQAICSRCSDNYDCFECVQNPHCSWMLLTKTCSRKVSGSPAVTTSSECPVSCVTRRNCSSCLADHNCRWCYEKQECFPHSHHLLQYPLGQCHVYSIRSNAKGDNQCRNCSAHTTCASCLAEHRCGWCGTTNNPLVGRCVDGDFSGTANNQNCSAILSVNETVAWSYGRCPDVDECRLKIDGCHQNSTCFNTDGSYNCKCNRGFTGDGKIKCDKTCYHECHHGYCGPDYQCKCDIGWKGVNCSIDCLCNGYSTCSKGIGICDQCFNYTSGSHCDTCVNGSYGYPNDTSGCTPCKCNGHGVAEKGICDKNTGKCFCTAETTGENCDKCKDGLTGDARNGGICYHGCSSLTFIGNDTSGYLSTEVSRNSCLWVISSLNVGKRDLMFSEHISGNAVTITLHIKHINMSCIDSHLYVYDGVPGKSNTSLLAIVCGHNAETKRTITAKSGILSVEYESSEITRTKVPFYAAFQVHSCNNSCIGNRHCVQVKDIDFQCRCKPGWFGPDCKQQYCPDSCNAITGKGFCDQKTGHCVCRSGFVGLNCSENSTRSSIILEDMTCQNSFVKPRFGQVFLNYEKQDGKALMYGGRDLESVIESDVWLFDIRNKSCEKLQSTGKPIGRYYHCGVLYKEKMLIYGGKTANGISDKLLQYDLNTGTWSTMALSKNLPALYGHSCTLVGDVLYIIGGDNGEVDGLNEHTLAIHLSTSTWENMKIVNFPVKGLYGHSAVYDEKTNHIFVYGGIAFATYSLGESNRLLALDLLKLTWNEIQPMGNVSVNLNVPYSLFGHSAGIINDTMFIIGGYSDALKRGYNNDLLLWKMRCNQWLKLSLNNTMFAQENGAVYHPSIGQSFISVNESLYVFGGFDSQLFNRILRVALPTDSCELIREQQSCDSFSGCTWCRAPDTGEGCFTANTIPMSYCNYSNKSNFQQCSTDVIKMAKCKSFHSCSSCLATFPGTSGLNCRWCVGSGCQNVGESCAKTLIDNVQHCINAACEAMSCKSCVGKPGCMWTQYFLYQSEIRRSYFSSPAYDWNCFRASLEIKDGSLEYPALDKSPPNPCPANCFSYKSCNGCLTSKGSEAGSRHCLWSQKLKMCFPPSMRYLVCQSGDCGQISKSISTCPSMCNISKVCNQCLQMSGCGWCARPGIMGEGTCKEGGPGGTQSGICSKSYSPTDDNTWAPLLCPLENECLNGRHGCRSLEICIDKEYGYACKCKTGYQRDSGSGKCIPVCSQGCDHGVCIQPDVCKCQFGWTSNNCSVQCQCNGHSNCPNATHSDLCIQCYNNTQGKHCNECKVEFVGDPTKSVPCTSCSSHCNDRSSICVSKTTFASIPSHIRGNSSLLLATIKKGPATLDDLVCLNCEGNSEGTRCEDCISGFFENKNVCQRCQCNGHDSVCDKKKGTGCKCQHNTKSEDDDWSKQCNQCKSLNFYGSPMNGRQCFQRLTNEQSITIGNEKLHVGSEPTVEAIPPNRTMFFAVPPRFTNVNIRLTVDVLQGGLDLYIATKDNVFIVDVNFTTGEHTLVSPTLHSRKRRSVSSHIFMENAYSGAVLQDISSTRRFRRESPIFSNTTVPESVPKSNQKFASKDKLSMYTEYKGGLYVMRGIQRRVIIGIQYKYLDFSKDRFYVGVVTKGNENSIDTAAFIYFKQDLSQIDLFVFFSVFFSVFFLILSLFFLLWKIKQLHHGRQVVIQQQIALVNMASRPFASYTVQCERNETVSAYAKVHSELLENTRGRKCKRDRLHTLSPMAVEFTEDELAAVATVFIQFPENEESLWNLSLGSGILQATPQQLLNIASSANGPQKATTRFMSTVTS